MTLDQTRSSAGFTPSPVSIGTPQMTPFSHLNNKNVKNNNWYTFSTSPTNTAITTGPTIILDGVHRKQKDNLCSDRCTSRSIYKTGMLASSAVCGDVEQHNENENVVQQKVSVNLYQNML
uniref:Liprin-beta n=1 Tax=Lygus hesperus TaxID=30085 RepID=A0A0A9W1Q6_LYGHE